MVAMGPRPSTVAKRRGQPRLGGRVGLTRSRRGPGPGGVRVRRAGLIRERAQADRVRGGMGWCGMVTVGRPALLPCMTRLPGRLL